MHLAQTIEDGIKAEIHEGFFLRGGKDKNVMYLSSLQSSLTNVPRLEQNKKLWKSAH